MRDEGISRRQTETRGDATRLTDLEDGSSGLSVLLDNNELDWDVSKVLNS